MEPVAIDWSELTQAVEFSSVSATILTVAAAVFGVLVIVKGISLIKKAL